MCLAKSQRHQHEGAGHGRMACPVLREPRWQAQEGKAFTGFGAFVEGNGAKFFVAIQRHDDDLARYLQRSGVAFVSLGGAAEYPVRPGAHWTPEGHAFVSERIFQLLAGNEAMR